MATVLSFKVASKPLRFIRVNIYPFCCKKNKNIFLFSADNTKEVITLGKIYKIKGHKKPSVVPEIISEWKNEDKISTDVLGSYTGTPSEKGDIHPVQDADDL